ncbi:unnamed protein product [Peronospora destructor]|uniref:Uncharacterized protein n=1 Tax=Peronospora destructor TaxID=86335 RepID=A0AAV0V220_9STRA|nr:unnamed protein product [Peronospora destructor]
MELFAGFNAEDLAMMQELLRLLVEDDDVLTQQPTPCTSTPQNNQALLFDGLTDASPKPASGKAVDAFDNYYSGGMSGPMTWNAPPVMIASTPQFATRASRSRTRSNFASEEEPMLKRGRVDVASTMRTHMNRIPVPEGGYPYY